MKPEERAVLVTEVANAVINQLNPRLTALEDGLKAVARRQNSLQKSLDILDNDRNIFEDTLGVARQTQTVLQAHRDHQQEASKTISNEMKDIREGVQDLTGELAHKLEEQVGQIIKTVESKKVVLVKPSFFAKLFKRGVKAPEKKGSTEEVKPDGTKS